MEIDFGKWFLLAVTSGLAAGLMNNVTSLLTGRFERVTQSRARAEERKHAAIMRREAAHQDARDHYLPTSEALAEWAEELAYEVFFEEVGDPIFRPPTARKGIQDEAEALDALRKILYGHPSKTVRDHAKSLFKEVARVYSAFEGDGEAAYPLTLERAKAWSRDADTLIELIHTQEHSGDPLGRDQ